MSKVLTDLTAREILKANGWIILHDQPNGIVAFKWGPNTTRHELSIRFDRGGRVSTWSEWQNKRISIDGEDGRRSRLQAHIESYDPRAA